MNTQLLIDAIRAHDDLSVIAKTVGVTIDQLKDALVNSIKLNPSDIEQPVSDEDTASTSSEEECDEDVFDKTIRKSQIKFSDEQKQFLTLAVKEKKNLMLAAPAGYGKSAVITTCVELMKRTFEQNTPEWFKKRYGSYCNAHDLASCPTVGLCASTGKAASLIGGRTFHSYFGIGLGAGKVDDWVKRLTTLRYLRNTYDNLRSVQVIIIDEISMISAEMLDKISDYLQKIRKCDEPFAGVQMVFIGDMAQLGPVGTGQFMFNSAEYIAAKVEMFRLTKCFRQSDPVFLKILNEIRYGECSADSLKILKAQTSIDKEFSQGLKPLILFSTNAEVDRVNESELMEACRKAETKPVAFPVKIVPGLAKKAEAAMKLDSIPEEVKLVVGAQIVVTHNINLRVVNGSQGKVVRLNPNEVVVDLIGVGEVTIGYVDYKDPEHPCVFSAPKIFSYLPIKLGYASTVHKVQGMSVSLICVDMKKVFCHGQGYVAISRCTDMRGLLIKNVTSAAFICNPSVKKFLLQ